MKRVEAVMIGCLAIAAATALGQISSAPQQPKPQKASQKMTTGDQERGQQVFKQNCSRCHQEPQGFSPSISGTIAKHMRVRAGLSDEDYKALMKFLNP
jgi:mono/diheme cytochrome c family protein